jgi:hypothetical protein
MKEENYKCVVSGKKIPAERIEALKMLGVHESRWTCVEHAFDMPRKGIYMGEAGTSELRIVNKVYDDSVRAIFRGAQKSTEYSEEEDTEKGDIAYNQKELIYYSSDEEQVEPEEKIEIIKRHT